MFLRICEKMDSSQEQQQLSALDEKNLIDDESDVDSLIESEVRPFLALELF